MSRGSASTLIIDVAEVQSREALHELLADAFHFPDYYGRNWDAFDECIRDVSLPPRVTIRGLKALRNRLPREAELLSQCVRGLMAEDPRRNVTFFDS
jgi:ribonuclease inhibitor